MPLAWDEKQLADVLKSKEFVENVLDGRNRAANNLKAEIKNSKEARKLQQTVFEYKLPRNARKVASPLSSVPSTPEILVEEKMVPQTLHFDKFRCKDPLEPRKGSQNLNTKYYNGRDFNIRLQIDKK